MHEPSLVVSLHDVSPKTHDDCAAILTELASLGVPHCSLLVIPNHHHSGHFLENPRFSHWLQLQTALGHEPVIHGYYHQRPRKPRESLLAKWTTQIYTADEGEFFDLSHADSLALLHQAQADFKKLHLHPTGFIAPAWLLGPLAQSALPSTPGSYTTRLGSVLDL
ncbi:MAG: DUF2334 domain-containing protein, partial [Verrucomicrobia bacterium]|nr:DUF2334 domain-containing protein [Verrucomicrobiota bacterium]